MSWAPCQPRMMRQEIEGLRLACVKVDQVGRLIGMTRIQAAELVLQELAEVFQAMSTLIERYDRRFYAYRKNNGLLTAEELASTESQATEPAAEPGAAEEG